MKQAEQPICTFPLMTDYLGYMEAIKGRSEGTIREYRYDLTLFFRFLKQHYRLVPSDAAWSDISIEDVDLTLIRRVTLSDCYAFLTYLTRQRKASPATRARKASSVKGFFKYLKGKAGVLETDPTVELEPPRQPKRLPTYLELNEAQQLLEAADNPINRFSERDYSILTLFLNCGLRLSELCGINTADIRGDSLTVVGKGNKERTVYLNAACLEALERYLRVRPVRNVRDPEALYISRQGNRISRPAVQLMIKKYIQMAGLNPQRYSTHKLRHTAATLMHKYGHVDIRMLQLILGHESVSTTEIYTHVDMADLHTAVEQNPLAGERPADRR